jgi:quinol monooxygenase YgiN
MFARMVECQAQNGRSEEMNTTLVDQIVPILKKQPGFIDFIALADKRFPERLICISLWDSRETADQFHRQHYRRVIGMLEPLFDSAPTLETFAVNASTAHNLSITQAA